MKKNRFLMLPLLIISSFAFTSCANKGEESIPQEMGGPSQLGPGSASGSGGGGAFALDADGSVTISKGTLIVFGGIEAKSPSTSLTKTLCSSSTVNAGTHTISFSGGTSYSTVLKSSTNGCIVYSELGTATLN